MACLASVIDSSGVAGNLILASAIRNGSTVFLVVKQSFRSDSIAGRNDALLRAPRRARRHSIYCRHHCTLLRFAECSAHRKTRIEINQRLARPAPDDESAGRGRTLSPGRREEIGEFLTKTQRQRETQRTSPLYYKCQVSSRRAKKIPTQRPQRTRRRQRTGKVSALSFLFPLSCFR